MRASPRETSYLRSRRPAETAIGSSLVPWADLVIIFCDTSVLVAASVRRHPHYARARPILEAIAAGRYSGKISTHSVAETFSALTSLPLAPRILPLEAQQIVATNVLRHFALVTVSAKMYARAVSACVSRSLGGGAVYDALLLECARVAKSARIYTFNTKDFMALAPDLAARIQAP